MNFFFVEKKLLTDIVVKKSLYEIFPFLDKSITNKLKLLRQ